MNVWKIGSRWSDDGNVNSSVLDIFKKYNIVFADPKRAKSIKSVKTNDLIAVTDGITVVSAGIILSEPKPVTNFKFEDKDKQKFDYEEWVLAFNVKLFDLEDVKKFHYTRGTFNKVHEAYKEKIYNFLYGNRLLYFKVKNSRSFEEEAELSMISTEINKKTTNSVYNKKYNINILQSALIYGANAAGKSNLLKALADAILMIRKSQEYTKNQKDKQLKYYPNKTKKYNLEQPTFYTFGFLLNNTHFEYSYSNTNERIETEILIENPNNNGEIIHFNRIYIEKKGEYIWTKGSKIFEDKFQFLEPFVKKENLFLSVASQLSENIKFKISLADEILDFFNNKISSSINIVSPGRSEIAYAIISIHKDKNKKKQLLDLLKKADFTIKDIVFKPVLNKKGENHIEIYTSHEILDKNNKQRLIEYDLFNEESVGTLQFIAWVGYLFTVAENRIFIIDEFGNHMHPHLTEYLLEVFQDSNCQLIFTTHNVKLMNSKNIRNDQKWIVNRDGIGNSKIYSISDYDIDEDKMLDNVYLDGLLGGIPNIKK